MEETAYTAEPESHMSCFIETETEHWSAKKWTETIMKRDIVERSRLKLDTRLYEFLKESQVEDQKMFEDTRNKVAKIIQHVKVKHDERYPEGAPDSEPTLVEMFKAGCREASETAYEYVQILDVMVSQAPEYVALAYGAVKILLVAQINYEDMKQNVESYLLKIKTKFQMIDHLTCYVPTARLVDAIATLYELFYRFVAKALKFYTRSRLKHVFISVVKPWKKLEPLVTLIEQTFTDVKDIVQFHGHITGQMNLILSQKILAVNQGLAREVKHILDILEEPPVKFSKPGDVAQMRDLLRQRVDENLDQPTKNGGPEPHPDQEGSIHPIMFKDHKLKSTDTTSEESAVSNLGGPVDLDQFLGKIFVELHEYDDICAQQQRILEQLPEMRPHRSKERNILKVDKVMSWVESPASKLLWIDGNHHLQRHDFNASFAMPLILLGESISETYLILRHFCGDSDSNPPTGCRTLIQSLLRQLFKQRPDTWKKRENSLSRDGLSDIKHLWGLFVECLKEVHVQCTFIVIDSIDYLEATSMAENSNINEGDFILKQLNNLVKDPTLVVKVLLTAAIAQAPPNQSKARSALTAYQPTSLYQPQRKLSLNILEEEFALAPQKLVEIQERRCRTIKFAQLPMLYQINSTIYAYDNGELRAFVVSELAGMDPRPFDTYSPLQIRAWSIDHNGKYFAKRYHDLAMAQFPGERDIANLTYIPEGFLNDESENRTRLLERGRMYWKLGSGVRYQQFMMAGRQTRIIIDQCTRPIEPPPQEQGFEEQLEKALASDLKPLILIVCPPRIAAYVLRDLKWITILVKEIEDIRFTKGILNKLVLQNNMKELLIRAIEPYMADKISGNSPRLAGYSSHDASIILLEGVPGSGKTVTATYAADHIRRPMLSVSPGDLSALSVNATEVTDKLKNFLQLAQQWNAALLFEDAHVILKSWLVTLIQGLDSHTGLVFMATDGSTVNDMAYMAFKSRVQVTIGFFKLNTDEKEKLWRIVLEEFSDIAGINADKIPYWSNCLKGLELNGREIKTSLKIAIQMAKTENRPLHLSDILRSIEERSESKYSEEKSRRLNQREVQTITGKELSDEAKEVKEKD
ncbi:hypothetical protein G7Y89_g13035 [Cudoniella acicularis]|uniref:AAA+ ATPase domain-containing protein n=1 Tax=Cudoniella acicularis TaxID=354080 RepID=A0A8H4RAE3_9HELO|nr:hypothetical protein G7Y89_g13035 [Cudoniella acicularis]